MARRRVVVPRRGSSSGSALRHSSHSSSSSRASVKFETFSSSASSSSGKAKKGKKGSQYLGPKQSMARRIDDYYSRVDSDSEFLQATDDDLDHVLAISLHRELSRRSEASSEFTRRRDTHRKRKEAVDLLQDLDADMRTRREFNRVIKQLKAHGFEMMFYIMFLLLFTWVAINSRANAYGFLLNEYMREQIIAEVFNPDELAAFDNIVNEEDTWLFLVNPLVEGVFGDNSAGGRGYLQGKNRMLGPLRVRQIRIVNESCPAEAKIPDGIFPNGCVEQMSFAEVETRPYGGPNGTLWEYRDEEVTGSVRQFGVKQFYEGGGYIQDFSLSETDDAITARLEALRDGGWVDDQTAAIIVELSTYNAHINLFQSGTFVMEFAPSGGVLPKANFNVFRLYHYTGDYKGRLQFVLESLLALFILGYIIQEFYEVFLQWRLGYATWGFAMMRCCCACCFTRIDTCRARQERARIARHKTKITSVSTAILRYFGDAWNIIDVINLSLFITAGVLRIRALSKAPVFDFNDADTFVNFQTVALLATSERNVLAINAALVWFKLLKYMAFLPGFQLISRTLVESIKSVVTITMVSLSIIMGFAVSGVLAFGDDVAGFETTTHAFISLYRSLNGEIDYAGLRASNRVLGPVFFVTFNVMVVLVFLNLFLATLVDAWSTVSNKQSEADFVKLLIALARDRFGNNVTEAVVEDNDDLNNTEFLQERDFKKFLEKFDYVRKRLNVGGDALGRSGDKYKKLFAQFDRDGNKVLDRKEQARLWHFLGEMRREVEALEKATIPTPTLMAMERVENQVTALGHRVDSLAESMEKLMTVVAGQAKSESS